MHQVRHSAGAGGGVIVAVFEAGVDASRGAGLSGRFADSAIEVPLIGRASNFNGNTQSLRSREDSFFKRLGSGLGAILRLVVPVLLLVTLGGASFVYAGTPAPLAYAQPWLNIGLLVLPLTFLAIHLTGRRYGAGYAFAQVVLAYAAIFGAAFYFRDAIQQVLNENHVAPRIILGFAAGLFVAHLTAIFLFDRFRGPRWWQAPLVASLFGGLVLSLIAFPTSYAGTGIDWTGRMLDYMGVTSMAALLLILPYWMMRSLVPPRSGFGGY